MEPEDFDFDEFMENSNRDFEMKLEAYRDRMMTMAIETNYDNLVKNGINEWHLRHLDEQALRDLENTFTLMISHYEALEEYEKCGNILKEKLKVESVLKVKTT